MPTDTLVAYVGPLYTPRQPQPHCRELQDAFGAHLGTCYIKSSWRSNGRRMCQVGARVQGVDYTGRGVDRTGTGLGRVEIRVRLRRCAKQPRR